MEHVSEASAVFAELKKQILERVDLSREVPDEEMQELIDEVVSLRKTQKMSQSQLAKLTGNKQQAISRIENKEHSPSLKLFYSMVRALGYDLKIVKG